MRHLFSIALFFLAIAASGQKDVGGFAHASLGVSLPMGDFASTDGNNPAAGYAKTGVNINALFGHKIHKQFGMFAMVMFDAHGVNKQALTRNLNQISGSYHWEAEGAIWTLTGVTFGPHFSQNFKKSAFDLRFGIGALNFISPKLTINGTPVTSGAGKASYVQKEKKSSAWMLGGGMTFKYEIKWGWVLLLNADYYQANPEFENVETVTEIEGQPDKTVDVISFSQEFKMLQLTTGVGIVF